MANEYTQICKILAAINENMVSMARFLKEQTQTLDRLSSALDDIREMANTVLQKEGYLEEPEEDLLEKVSPETANFVMTPVCLTCDFRDNKHPEQICRDCIYKPATKRPKLNYKEVKKGDFME